MIPLRDTTPSRNIAVATYSIIGLNLVAYWVQIAHGNQLDQFIYIYGLVPARYSVPQLSAYFTMGQQLFSLVSFMFLHGGFWHLLSNMWSLYIFGDNVEDYLGPLRYVVFYLLCGFASGLSHLLLNQESNIPTIGASGAIAGVMGAYFILHPNARILTLIPIIIIPYFIEIPAFFFLGFWLFLQIINAAGSHGAGGIAWWAHIGGFIFGIIFLKLFKALPSFGMTSGIRRITAKKKSHRLQVIRPIGPGNDPHLYGTIIITPHEARTGVQKLVNIPWGFQKRMVRITVPPGIEAGSQLRLKGLGKLMGDGNDKGDLFLKVVVRQ